MEGIHNLIYFDNNATTRLDERVEQAMQTAGNADAAALRQESAMRMAQLIHCKPGELFFTTGITPAIHLLIENSYEAYRHKGRHIITSQTEHAEVLKALEKLSVLGAEITYLGVDREGLVDADALKAAIRNDTSQVIIMTANNQTGVIQPIERIAEICKQHGIFFFSDASQYVGKLRCDVQELGVDALVFGSHKMHGPKEIGVLYIKEDTLLCKMMREKKHHEILLPAALLAGFAKAAEICEQDRWENSAHVSKLKNYFEHQLLDVEGLRINGSTRHRLYNTSNLTFPAKMQVASLAGQFKFMHYNSHTFYVLKAMGVAEEELPNSFRFSFGKYNTLDEVKLLVEKIMALS